MVETMTTLLLGNPDLDIFYTHKKDGKSYAMNSHWLKERFNDRSPVDPEVIRWLKIHLREGLAQIGVQG
jgi:hypothetical protein